MIAARLALAATTWAAAVALLASAPAASIRVAPVLSDEAVAVAFSAPDALGDDAQAVVRSGLLLTFTFVAELRRPTGFWWDRTVASATVGSTVKFDNLTGVYQVSKLHGDHVTWSDRTMDLAAVRTWMTTFERVPLAPRGELEANAEYSIRVSLQVSPRRTFTLWPWADDAASGRATFVNIR
jgi:hypothetical protein